MPNTQLFDVRAVNLEGSNLIEASAGTGKTYSIAILVLRLILEKKVPIGKILMVTFTKAAVAELESRIRKFVRKAYKYAYSNEPTEPTIQQIVDNCHVTDKIATLQKAVQSLDNLSVMTIHSFCQQVITQNPFETRQSFEAELMTDVNDLIMYYVNDYWRQKINTMDDPQLFRFLNGIVSRSTIKDVIAKSLDDKTFVFRQNIKGPVLDEIKKLLTAVQVAKSNYQNHIQTNWNDIANRIYGSKHAFNFFNANNTPHQFEISFLSKAVSPPNYFGEYFPRELHLAQSLNDSQNKLNQSGNQYVSLIYSELIEQVNQRIVENKQSKDLITYDDLISRMQEAVLRGSVNQVLLNQYDAVFVDEFQDTDKKQYDIFGKLFNQKLIFYIGDPKQSIYGWRKADIHTYKTAKNEVATILSMNKNFRSTKDLIDAMNTLFGIDNPFYDNDIQYIDVDNGANDHGSMTENGQTVIPVAINHFQNNTDILEFLKNEILRLLIDKSVFIAGQSVEPSDIAVIVRTNTQAKEVRKILSSVNIPSITIDDSSVLSSDEAVCILSLLIAIQKPNRGGINKVLLNKYFGFNRVSVESLNDEYHLDLFKTLYKEWHDNGIYNMLSKFFEVYNVRAHCFEKGIIGQRSLSNFYQIAEILHQTALSSKYTPDELVAWLQKEKECKSEEYEQRIESEDKAVQISTIHKSKGLTYKIVFAPFLDLKIKTNCTLFDFRDEEGYKFTGELDADQKKLYDVQNEQENRRLIYVALTRAQFKNYICENTHGSMHDSSLKPFLKTQSPFFEIDVIKGPAVKRYTSQVDENIFAPREKPQIEIKNTFGIHSFSGLSKTHYTALFENAKLGEPDNYDQFIFQELGRGANVGTALHSIFERLNFADPDSWDQTLTDASKYYPNIIKTERLWQIKHLVEQVMNANINCNGVELKLCELKNEQKLPELEFYFSMSNINKSVINEILGEAANLKGEADIEGLMLGFMDLLFEHNGKYYILDWKSNHLGNSIENYQRAGMEEAMTGSNYHLQYMIYTVAAKRWLTSKINGFDYERDFGGIIYVFLRGVRNGLETGIYSTRPNKEDIEKLDAAL